MNIATISYSYLRARPLNTLLILLLLALGTATITLLLLASAQLETPWPGLGSRNGEAVQAGVSFVWRENVSGTPNPAFRKIDIVVADAAQPDYALAQLSGYLGQPAAQ